MDTMEESVDDLMLMLMKDDETKFNHGYRDGTVQELRRNTMFMRMMGVARAAERAANLVMSIVEENEERMQMDDDHHLLITGTLAIYRVDIGSFLTKFVNPFDHNSFDVVEVHPKSGLVKEPKTACVQVQPQKDMPAYDLLAGYILGLLNDHVTWLQDSLSPLRRALFQIYGLAQSPLTASMENHFANLVGGVFDYTNDTFTFEGTNGWFWRLHFGQPLKNGYKMEYQKPRQSWWNTLFEDHENDSTGHYTLSGFFEVVEHLSDCPRRLKEATDWNTDPIFLRKVASDYPPVAKAMAGRLMDDDYSPDEIYSFYDEPISSEQADTVRLLDHLILQRAHA